MKTFLGGQSAITGIIYTVADDFAATIKKPQSVCVPLIHRQLGKTKTLIIL